MNQTIMRLKSLSMIELLYICDERMLYEHRFFLFKLPVIMPISSENSKFDGSTKRNEFTVKLLTCVEKCVTLQFTNIEVARFRSLILIMIRNK